MRPLRVLLVLLLIGGGIGASLVLISKEMRSLHGSPLFQLSPSTTTAPPGRPRTRPSAASERRRPRHTSGRRPAPPHPAPRRSATNRPPAPRRHSGGGLGALVVAGLEIAAGLLLLGLLLVVLALRRLRRRSRREYALYELHLSTHDQAKGQDLEDMVESIANIVRAWPADRLRDGQPYVALELICGGAAGTAGGDELEWSINVRCEPRAVAALDGAISAAYPDVRLGRAHGEEPRPRPGALREPGYVMRFRKERSFVYSLIADGEEQASSPLEQIARAQIAAGAPSIVRFQLTPTPSYFEELARRLYRRHENKLVRQERWGLPEGGLISTFNRAEMHAAERTQNRSLFWLETVIAAEQPRGVQDGRRRRAVAPRREPPSPPLDDHPPAALPPPVRARARTADPLVPHAGLGRRGRAPARAPVGADEGRPRPPGDDPADPRPARGDPRPPRPPCRAERRERPGTRPATAAPDAVTAGSFSEGGAP